MSGPSNYHSGEIKVDYGTVQKAAEDIRSSIGEIQHWLSDLEANFKALDGRWEGSQAQTAYLDAKIRWNSEIGEMLSKFQTLGVKATDAAEGIATADKKAARGFELG